MCIKVSAPSFLLLRKKHPILNLWPCASAWQAGAELSSPPKTSSLYNSTTKALLSHCIGLRELTCPACWGLQTLKRDPCPAGLLGGTRKQDEKETGYKKQEPVKQEPWETPKEFIVFQELSHWQTV